MTWSLLFRFASAFALAQGAASGNQTWIADIRAMRESLATGEVRVEGVVVDIRSTASEARRGLYRLIDESDREGVLIRTAELPADGGAYRVRAIVAQQQPQDGPGKGAGGPTVLTVHQRRIDRNEGRREHTLTEQVLQEVWNAQRGQQRRPRGRGAEVMGQQPLSHEAEQPRKKDARPDHRGIHKDVLPSDSRLVSDMEAV